MTKLVTGFTRVIWTWASAWKPLIGPHWWTDKADQDTQIIIFWPDTLYRFLFFFNTRPPSPSSHLPCKNNLENACKQKLMFKSIRIELKVIFLWITYLDHSSEKVRGIWFFLVQMAIIEIYRGRHLEKIPCVSTWSSTSFCCRVKRFPFNTFPIVDYKASRPGEHDCNTIALMRKSILLLTVRLRVVPLSLSLSRVTVNKPRGKHGCAKFRGAFVFSLRLSFASSTTN